MAQGGLQQALGLAVRRQRQQAGISQERLAELAGVERAYVSALERGRRNPTLTTLAKVASALGMRLARLVDEAERME